MTVPQNNNIIGHKKKNNRAARADALAARIFAVSTQQRREITKFQSFTEK